jgi:HrpA-like RNA helicase
MIDEYMRERGERVNIICTQPRRLAAITLAQRVSDEMSVGLGDRVGYQVGMDSRMSDKTRILFVTTGIFLQRLVHERELFFSSFTHIIMDEVHERDIDIDFSLIIMKHFLKVFPRTRMILMSATICAEKFANYFARDSIQKVDDE